MSITAGCSILSSSTSFTKRGAGLSAPWLNNTVTLNWMRKGSHEHGSNGRSCPGVSWDLSGGNGGGRFGDWHGNCRRGGFRSGDRGANPFCPRPGPPSAPRYPGDLRIRRRLSAPGVTECDHYSRPRLDVCRHRPPGFHWWAAVRDLPGKSGGGRHQYGGKTPRGTGERDHLRRCGGILRHPFLPRFLPDVPADLVGYENAGVTTVTRQHYRRRP